MILPSKRRRREETWRGNIRRCRALPRDEGPCGWIEPLDPPPPAHRLRSEEHADCAVLGAGFTGLAAARRLAELRPDWRIALVDARRAGDGASGRSSGFVVDLVKFVEAMPEDETHRFLRLSRAGIEDLRQQVEHHEIACDWDTRGWLHVAAGDAGLHSLETLPPWMEKLGASFEWLDTDAMENLTGSRFYRAGLRLVGSVTVQAGALTRGLATHLPESVELFEESPVEAIERARSSAGWCLRTAEGSLTSPRLAVALNAYATSFGILARRIFPLLTFGSFTRRLNTAELAELGNETSWALLAQDAMGSSVRRTVDGRLLIRNTIHYQRDRRIPVNLWPKIRDTHRQALLRRYPGFGNIPFETTWAGVMGSTPSLQPFLGHLAEGLVAAGGFTGAGIAMGTTYGRLMAEMLVGESSSLLDDALALPGPARLPPEPFLSLGIGWRARRMNASAGNVL